MSRLIIKNLPSYITPARLQDHFESKKGPGGSLTDVKVALKPDGTSRRFGFVGYKTEKQATAAKEWFDRTFIDSNRIGVSAVEVRCILLFMLPPSFSSLMYLYFLVAAGYKRRSYSTT
jgi:multiple RNA-binding domain-containing protein 1